MKKVALAAALTLAATGSFAGNMAEPAMEPEVIVADTASSDGGILVPLLFITFVAATVLD